MMNEQPTLSVIIISYNTRDMTLDCLRDLYADLGDLSAEVWVVDNASTDGSVAAIRQSYPKVLLIENAGNKGFGAANNQAMAQAQGEFFLLLNSDAFPKPGAISTLVNYLRLHSQVGAVGPRLLNADGSLQMSCWKFPSPSRAWLENLGVAAALPNHPVLGDYYRWAHDQERIVDFVIGACLLVRRSVYEQVGGFDESFFMYAEETDWQRRMWDAGWQIAFLPVAEVTHLGGASGASDKARINNHFYNSMDYYVQKHHRRRGLLSLRLATMIGCVARVLLWSLILVGVPRHRAKARAKVRLLSWLLVRQATHWRAEQRSS